MTKIFDFVGGRKMFFALLLLAIATIFIFSTKDGFDTWSTFVIWIFGTYCIGNSMEHLSEIHKKGK